MTRFRGQGSGYRGQIFLFSVFCLLVSGILGCGYTTHSLISTRYKTIYIPPFENKSDITGETYANDKYKIYKPYIDTDITRAVINKFLIDGNLKPVTQETADVILKGAVIEFRRDPLRYDDNNEVQEYRINLIVNISLRSPKDDKTVWDEPSFTGTSTYFTTGAQAKPETTAINDAVNDLARRIVERTVEDW